MLFLKLHVACRPDPTMVKMFNPKLRIQIVYDITSLVHGEHMRFFQALIQKKAISSRCGFKASVAGFDRPWAQATQDAHRKAGAVLQSSLSWCSAPAISNCGLFRAASFGVGKGLKCFGGLGLWKGSPSAVGDATWACLPS